MFEQILTTATTKKAVQIGNICRWLKSKPLGRKTDREKLKKKGKGKSKVEKVREIGRWNKTHTAWKRGWLGLGIFAAGWPMDEAMTKRACVTFHPLSHPSLLPPTLDSTPPISPVKRACSCLQTKKKSKKYDFRRRLQSLVVRK
jgi:hypothetical protein